MSFEKEKQQIKEYKEKERNKLINKEQRKIPSQEDYRREWDKVCADLEESKRDRIFIEIHFRISKPSWNEAFLRAIHGNTLELFLNEELFNEYNLIKKSMPEYSFLINCDEKVESFLDSELSTYFENPQDPDEKYKIKENPLIDIVDSFDPFWILIKALLPLYKNQHKMSPVEFKKEKDKKFEEYCGEENSKDVNLSDSQEQSKEEGIPVKDKNGHIALTTYHNCQTIKKNDFTYTFNKNQAKAINYYIQAYEKGIPKVPNNHILEKILERPSTSKFKDIYKNNKKPWRAIIVTEGTSSQLNI